MMLYKLLNKLFGWDYILWESTCDRGIVRILKDKTGVFYYWRYKNIKSAAKINKPSDVKLWLTCSPEKYFNKQLKEQLKEQNNG